MKTLLVMALAWTLAGDARCDGFLYVFLHKGVEPKVEIKNGGRTKELSMPFSTAGVTDVVLRHDAKDRSIFWLELHMAEALDAEKLVWLFPAAEGTKYRFQSGRSEIHAKGCKWTLRFDKIQKGREVLSLVGMSYGLTPKHVKDESMD